MRRFVAYLRAATNDRRQSSLDLDAQRAAVAGFVSSRGELLAEFVEAESRREDKRPELTRALNLCQGYGTTLAIAKLDRLARNPVFLTALFESGVEFAAMDMPQVDRLALPILIAVAKREREMISRRTAIALQEARARGVRLGNPRAPEAAASGRAVLSARSGEVRRAALPIALPLRAEGLSLQRIADLLNARGVATPRGGHWHAATAAAMLRQAALQTPSETLVAGRPENG
jgi:DNA invertase Pin-like site-specific DNA recombinase